jgi:hypothetical protein
MILKDPKLSSSSPSGKKCPDFLSGRVLLLKWEEKKWQHIKIRRGRSIPSTPHAGIWGVLFPGMMLKRPGIAHVMDLATTLEEK